MKPSTDAQNKDIRAYAQGGQYRTTVESRVQLTMFKLLNDESLRSLDLRPFGEA